MKANHRQFYMILLVVALFGLQFCSIVQADTVFASCMGETFNTGTIMRFDSTGNGVEFASDLANPTGLTFDTSGDLYVSGIGVKKFDSNGNRTVFFTDVFYNSDITFDSSGELYSARYSVGFILDFETGQQTTVYEGWIRKHSPDGTYLGVFASDLTRPLGLAFDEGGELYVSDVDSIKKYDTNGNETVFASGLTQPMGLAFDSSGNLYVADNDAGTIMKYDSSGNGMVFTSGLMSPVDVAFDSLGNLYATDYDAGTIMKYDPNGNGVVFASGVPRVYAIAVQVPEPTTLLLFGLGGLVFRKRRK